MARFQRKADFHIRRRILVMAALFGMTGVWLAFCAAEAITAGVMAVAMKKTAIVTIPRKN